MKKLTRKGSLILYGCSGLGVNMLNLIVGSYLCSALLVGGFEKNAAQWTYFNKDIVISGIWAVMIVIAKILDGLIDLPLSHFVDNIKSRFGKRKTGILLGYVPMVVTYLLFLVPINTEASALNTVWFGALLLIYYCAYTLTMITYYATFAEVSDDEKGIILLSNTKSICDVIYFCLGFALLPAFISMGLNIRLVALIFLPLSLTMLIPVMLLKENFSQGEVTESSDKMEHPTFLQALRFALKDKAFIGWLFVLAVVNLGLQLFLSGINEYFSTLGLDMTFIMASCFIPVPFTILIYNQIVKKRGLGFAYRYILLVFSAGMVLMGLVRLVPQQFCYAYAICCSLIVSLSIGAFFSVSYTVPSQCAALRKEVTQNTSSMYFAIQGMFEGASASLASGPILVFFKEHDTAFMPYLTFAVAGLCMAAFVMTFFLPKGITTIGKKLECTKACYRT